MGGKTKMSISRRKNALMNILFGYIAQLGILILSFVGRKVFLNLLTIEYLGINGLYSNILMVLSLAELGVDSAVVYSLYKPVADDNKPLIYSLIQYFKKIYVILALSIFCIGMAVIPFLKYIVKSGIPQNKLMVYYVLFLINTVATYFVAYKIALLFAYQQQRVHKLVLLSSNLILQVLHIIVLIIWHNYCIYILATIMTTIINNVILGRICNRLYKDVFKKQELVTFNKKPIRQRIFSSFLYKIGAVAINNTDNILISTIVNITAVGLYSNYYTIVAAIQGFIGIITTSLISGIGNLGASGDRKRQHEIFDMMLLFYHFIAAMGGIGFSLLFNDLIIIWLGQKFLFKPCVVLIIAMNFYLTTAVSPVWMYREANGLFKQVRYLMLIRATLNIVLSIALGMIWGISGIFMATAMSMLLTSFWYEPRILYKNLFSSNPKSYWLKQGKYFLTTVVVGAFSFLAIFKLENGILMFFLKVIIIIAITTILFLISNFSSKEISTAKTLIKFSR